MTGPALRLLAAAACAAATLLLPATAAIADWHQSVGGARPVNTAARNARSPNLQAIGGVPYVAWNEDTSVQGQGSSSTIHVSRLAADGQSWAGVAEGGPNPISLRTSSSSDNPWLADVGGTPWVAWDEGVTQTDKEIRVSRLNASGDAWQEVPSPPSAQPINVNADGNANRPTLADGGGRPYVSFYELDPGSGSLVGPAFFGLPNRAPSQVWVRRANAAGTGWDTVGGGPVSPDASKDAVFPRMTLVDGVPWAVWWQVDVVNNTPQATVEVSHLNDAGTAWVQMPPITTSVFGNQGPGISFPAIATVGDVPYIAYSDNGGSGNKRMRVYRLNDAATSFDPVGGPVSDGSAGADNPSIASIGGTPWVAWSEQGNSGGQLTRAARLVGGDWQQAGTTANADPAHAARYGPSLASVGGFPWVAFAENDNSAPGSPGCCVQTRVSRLEPTFTSTNAQSSDTTATLVAKVQTFGLPYPVGFHYGEGTSLGQATAPSAASGDPAFVVQSISGLTPLTVYSYAPFATAGTPLPLVEGPADVLVTQGAFSRGAGGASGAGGAAGAPGAPGADARLFGPIIRLRDHVRRGRAVAVGYLVSDDAIVEARISHAGRRVATLRRRVAAGTGILRWNGRLRRGPGAARAVPRAARRELARAEHRRPRRVPDRALNGARSGKEGVMASAEELDRLSSKELHDRAFAHAKRHLDARFFWRLIEMVPAAEAATGDLGEAGEDVLHPSSQVADAVDSDPSLLDGLRPVYIDYLVEHPDA
ncbi:MAG: hypothetical protein ACXVFK_15020 [Solirubrobacteraceae bacterium]